MLAYHDENRFDYLWALPTGITMYHRESSANEPTFAIPQIPREIQKLVTKLPPVFQDLKYQQKLPANTLVTLGRAADGGITSSSGAYLKEVSKRRYRRRQYNGF